MSGELPPPVVTNIEGIPAWIPAEAADAVRALAAAGKAPVQIQAWVYLIRPNGEFTYTHVVNSTPDDARIYEWTPAIGRDEGAETREAWCARAAAEALAWLATCPAPAEVYPPWRDRLVFAVWAEEE